MICIPITARTSAEAIADIEQANQVAQMVELRLDYLWPVLGSSLVASLETLIPACTVKKVVTLRTKEHGGAFDGDRMMMVAVFKKAIELKVDYLDVEYGLDILNELSLEGTRCILSLHDFLKTPPLVELLDLVKKMEVAAPDIYKIATKVNSFSDNLTLWQLIRELKRQGKKFIVIGLGELGTATRVLGPILGAEWTFAVLNEDHIFAPGQLTLGDLKKAWGDKEISTATAICGLIGSPIEHVKSPFLHHKFYAEQNIDAVYLPFLVNEAKQGIQLMETLDMRQLSVTTPYKMDITQYLDETDSEAEAIGSVNTVVALKTTEKTLYKGYNTDLFGLSETLKKAEITLHDKNIVLVGAGGAARMVAYLVKNEGGKLKIADRTLAKAKALADKFGGEALPLKELATLEFDVLINATPVGLSGNKKDEKKIFGALNFRPDQTVIDLIYNPPETLLLKKTKAAGARAVNGWEMLVAQARRQIELWAK